MKQIYFARPVSGEGRIIRQHASGGNRFGHVALTVEPSEAQTLWWSWDVPEDQIPRQFEAAVRRGILSLFEPEAKFAGRSLDGLRIRVTRGSYHETDSNEGSYEIAATMAFLEVVENAIRGNAT